MTSSFRKIMISLGLILGVAGTCFGQVAFQPEMLTLDLLPKQAVSAEVKVTNQGKVEEEFSVELESKQPGEKREIAWAEASPSRLRLRPGQSASVRITFRAEARRPEGEHLLALFIGRESKGQVPLKVRTGMPIFARLNHESRADGRIEKLEPTLLDNGELKLAVTVRNRGRMYLMPFGLAWLEDAAGAKVWQAELAAQDPVFPDQQRELVWQRPLPAHLPTAKTLYVRMFWGTLHELGKVGAPKSAVATIPFKARPERP